jgi:hypothetical protein
MSQHYKLEGIGTLSDFLGDHVVYRNLEPADDRLPGLRTLWSEIGLKDYRIPRKTEMEYARVLVRILKKVKALAGDGEITQLCYIGDTEYNDGTAFRNLKSVSGWPGYAFIARDTLADPPEDQLDGDWYVANRWSALPSFLDFVREQGITLGPQTAVIFDLDKTAIGARGRNDQVINEARMEGVERTVAGLLESAFDRERFIAAYEELNQTQYHVFTGDNQDYLAYICLMLGAGLYDLPGLVKAVQEDKFETFDDFIADVDKRRQDVAEAGLLSIHENVWDNVQAGDPTPFKTFRYNEYLTTVVRFGVLPDATAEEALQERIVITQEVRQAALDLRAAGAICFGVSDKPDEASVPSPEQAVEGYKPIHRLETMIVGASDT